MNSIKKLFIISSFASFLNLLAMDSPGQKLKKPKVDKPNPGCVRQNSDGMIKAVQEILTQQGNLGVLKELRAHQEKIAQQ